MRNRIVIFSALLLVFGCAGGQSGTETGIASSQIPPDAGPQISVQTSDGKTYSSSDKARLYANMWATREPEYELQFVVWGNNRESWQLYARLSRASVEATRGTLRIVPAPDTQVEDQANLRLYSDAYDSSFPEELTEAKEGSIDFSVAKGRLHLKVTSPQTEFRGTIEGAVSAECNVPQSHLPVEMQSAGGVFNEDGTPADVLVSDTNLITDECAFLKAWR
jgi:hypothetical protein